MSSLTWGKRQKILSKLWVLWYDTIWYMTRYDMIYDMMWYDIIRYYIVLYGTIWYDMARYGMIWYDMIYVNVWYDIWHDMILYDMIWYDTIDTIRYMIRYDMIWYDTIRYDMIYLSTAIGLTPAGSSTVHIYTKTIQRITQWNRIHRTYITIRIHKHNDKNI